MSRKPSRRHHEPLRGTTINTDVTFQPSSTDNPPPAFPPAPPGAAPAAPSVDAPTLVLHARAAVALARRDLRYRDNREVAALVASAAALADYVEWLGDVTALNEQLAEDSVRSDKQLMRAEKRITELERQLAEATARAGSTPSFPPAFDDWNSPEDSADDQPTPDPGLTLTDAQAAVLNRYQTAWGDGLVLRCRRCWDFLPRVRPLSGLIAAAYVHAADECPELSDAPDADAATCDVCEHPHPTVEYRPGANGHICRPCANVTVDEPTSSGEARDA